MQKPNPIPSCRACHAPLIWARTEKGALMPLDLEPTAAGNVELVETERGPRAKVHGAGRAAAGTTLYMPHHATCPDVRRFRRDGTGDEG